VDGDDYYEPAIYGSVLLHHLRMAKCWLGSAKRHTLVIENVDRSGRTTFPCIYFTLDALEFFQKGTDLFQPLAGVTPSVKLPPDAGNYAADPAGRLEVLSATFEPSLSGVDVSSGPITGGTAVVISGAEFPLSADVPDGATFRVFFGPAEVPPADVSVDSETEISVSSPAHAAGAVDVTVVFPSGVSKTLPAAFTYT